MAAIWKTVRVFISSTFRDMGAERDHLIKVVFPALRERLEKHHIYLIDIDLRWGVTREQAENDQVLGLCLDQIDECRPFFIGILGERYGWVPTRHPADAVNKFGWIQHHTGKSLTELEIIHGVLQNPQMRGRAFFYFRDPIALAEVPTDLRQQVYAETEPVLVEKLLELKRQIRDSGCPVMEGYPARWDREADDRPSHARGRLTGLEAFGERVGDELWQAIQQEFRLPDVPLDLTTADPLAEEQDHHERLMESRLRVYVGREQTNDALLAYAAGNDAVPCLVAGASGSGKSAALARFARDYQREHPQIFLIPHFIGASPRSTNLRDMLRRFCRILKLRFGFAEDVPEELVKLSITFREFVEKVPPNSRVVLLIDALNQLDEADRAHELYWLPLELPPQVKVIVSCITDSGKTEPALEAIRLRKHRLVELAALSDAEQRAIIRLVPSLSAKTLDDEQVRLLLDNPATANPLFLLVALEELRGFASYEQLNERIAAFPRAGDTVTAIFTQVIERLESDFNKKLVATMLMLLASARRGLSERELQELIVGVGDAADAFPTLRQLRPYLLSRAGLIDFYHRNLTKAVRERYLDGEQKQRAAHARLAEYFHAQESFLESREEQRQRAQRLPPTPRPANVRKVDELPWQRLQAQQGNELVALLTNIEFLEAKTEAGLVVDLVDDIAAAVGSAPENEPLRHLELLMEAIQRDIQFLTQYPTTLFQCLWNLGWWYDAREAVKHYQPIAPQEGADEKPAPPQAVPQTMFSRLAGLWRRPASTAAEPTVQRLPWDAPESQRLSALLEHWQADKQPRGIDPWLRTLRPPLPPLGSGQTAVLRGHAGYVTSVRFSPDDRRIASGSHDRTVRIWDAESGAELLVLRGHDDLVTSVCFSPDGGRIVSASEDKTVRVWEAAHGTELAVLRGHSQSVMSVSVSPDGRRIASGSLDGTVRIWDAASAADLGVLRGHEGVVVFVAFSPDGGRIASGSSDKTVRIWDAASGAEIAVLRGHERHVTSLSFSPDGQRIASGSLDGTVRIWDAANGAQLTVLRESEAIFQTAIARALAKPGEFQAALLEEHDNVMSVSFSPDGRRIVSGYTDWAVRIWDAESGAQLKVLRGHVLPVVSVGFSADGRRIVSGSFDCTVRTWDASSHADLRVLSGHQSRVTSVSFSPDGRQVVSGSNDLTVRIWDAASGAETAVLRGHLDGVSSARFSPDGRRVVSGSKDTTARVWDAASGKELAALVGHDKTVTCVCFSPDGRRIVSGSADHTVRMWNAAIGLEYAMLRGHEDAVTSVAYSPDGLRIASGSSDKTVRIWDGQSGAPLAVLTGHVQGVGDVGFSPNSRGLHSASWEGTLLLWDAATGTGVRRMEGMAPMRIDIQAVLGGAPWLMVSNMLETKVISAQGGRLVARFPGPLYGIMTHPSGRQWCAFNGNHVHLIVLEGAPHQSRDGAGG